MSDSTTIDVATQIAYPARTIVRTIVQSLVGALVAYLAGRGLDLSGMSPMLVELLTGAVWVAITAAATWVMTRPAVAKILAGTILAAHPEPAVVVADPVFPPASATANADGSVTSVPGDGTPPTTTLS